MGFPAIKKKNLLIMDIVFNRYYIAALFFGVPLFLGQFKDFLQNFSYRFAF